jgi:hypothetical protein
LSVIRFAQPRSVATICEGWALSVLLVDQKQVMRHPFGSREMAIEH